MVKIEPTNRHDRDAKLVGHVPYNLAPRMSIFLMRENKSVCRNHRSQSQQGSWLWSGSPMCLPSNVYVDKMKALVESLFADGHYNLCNMTLLNDNWLF